MAFEINSVIIGGNLTRDVVIKDTPTGKQVCMFTVANNRTFMSNNQKTTETSFIDVEVWGTLAQNCGKYLQKGSPVVVTGRMKQDRWQTPNGERRSRFKVVAANVQFLSTVNRGPSSAPTPPVRETVSADSGWEE